ncbi:MAG TPA: ATP-dependent zinc metalloprotease FtsH, partial [Actinomycetota bacterium]|nr:ATP-dependent zinc metalloprotease FtsH [Actinomycetota bacterium]
IGWVLFQSVNSPATPVGYSQFVGYIEKGPDFLTDVVVTDTSVSGIIHSGGTEQRVTASRLDTDTSTIRLLLANHIKFEQKPPSGWVGFVTQLVLMLILFGAIYFFLFRRMGAAGAGALNLGKNKVRIYDRKEMKTTFSDVAGVDEPVEELREVVDFLKNPKKYQRLGGRLPKGVLLLGPPGCGKTLLARAVAGEANVPFFFMSGSEFVEMFVGLGAARVRELFQQAKEKAPALVFLDEIDTIGKGRMGGIGGSMGSHDEREQTLNQLLVEMDGFDSSRGVIIMAATNRHDVLDPALIRPGRFDRQVVVDRPDLRGRIEILKVHARGVALCPNVDMQVIASRTPGFTGADLANVVNEAALLAARREKNCVEMVELEEAIDRVVAGLERKSRVIGEREREIVAVHEMGHALVALSVPTADPVHRVSIIPRGAAALGMTMQRPLEDRYLLTEPELADRLAILLGGRTAEEIAFKQISTGAADDLKRATDIAKAMVVEYGMSETIGPLAYGNDGRSELMFGQGPQYSGTMADAIDKEVTKLVTEAHRRATEILEERRELLDRLSKLLMAQEVIEGIDLEGYLTGTRPIPDPSSVSPNGHAVTEVTGPAITASPPE